MVAALLADVMLRRGSWPTTSLVAFTGLYGVHLLSLPATQQGQVRVLTCALLLALCVLPVTPSRRPAAGGVDARS